jgi:hypothetical protein
MNEVTASLKKKKNKLNKVVLPLLFFRLMPVKDGKEK